MMMERFLQRKKADAMRTMMGTRVPMTGRGVEVPKTSLDSATLKTGSRVFTVCVKLIATAAKDRLAATWPMACMAAGPAIFWNSALVMGCSMQNAVYQSHAGRSTLKSLEVLHASTFQDLALSNSA